MKVEPLSEREKERGRARARYHERREAGLCTECAQPSPAAVCPACAAIRRARISPSHDLRDRPTRYVRASPADRRAAHAAMERRLESFAEPEDEVSRKLLERRRAIVALGFDDLDAKWADSPAAHAAIERFGQLRLDDIALLWGISRERVRQIENRGAERIATLARRTRMTIDVLVRRGRQADDAGASLETLTPIYRKIADLLELLDSAESIAAYGTDPPDREPHLWDKIEALAPGFLGRGKAA